MVEIFRTNVTDVGNAYILTARIKARFPGYEVNFDLEDCDKILRVKALYTEIEPDLIIGVLRESGFKAQLLPENYPLPIIQRLIKKVAINNCW